MASITEGQIRSSRAAVDFAIQIREHHRRSSPRGGVRRETDIQSALDRLAKCMRPMRSYLAVAVHSTDPRIAPRLADVKEVSRQMQAERRKLWKMQARVR